MADILASVRKLAPLAAVAGYMTPYATKGWDRILIDLQTITYQKVAAKWQNAAIAAAAAAGYYFVQKSKLPAPIKVIALVALAYVAGYNAAMVIDPPVIARTGTGTNFVRPAQLNPYAMGGR